MPRNRPSPGSIGLPGGNYANRTDKATPTGLPYGEAGKLQAAEAAVPLTPPPTGLPLPAAPVAPMPPGPPAAGGGGVPPPGLAQMLASAAASPPPSGQSIFRPSERPNEPVTAGLPSGPGPGPEAIPMMPPSAVTTTYQTLADATGSPLLRQLATLSSQRDRGGTPQ